MTNATEEWERIRETMKKEFQRELEIHKRQSKHFQMKSMQLQKDLDAIKKYSKHLMTQRYPKFMHIQCFFVCYEF